MPIEARTLEAAAHKFCDRLNRLLNTTVTAARITAAAHGPRVMIALREGGEPGALLRSLDHGPLVLSLEQILTSDRVVRGRHRLRTVRYRYSLAVDRQTEAFLRWDYSRAQEHADSPYCRHHIQGTLPVRLPKGTARLNDFHTPSGYVAVEDIVRFLIVDLGVQPRRVECDETLKESLASFRADLGLSG